MRHLTATIDIDAPPERVWAALTDGAALPGWNPFLTRLDGHLAVGERLAVRVAPPGGTAMDFRPVVTAVEPHRSLEWLGSFGFRGLADGRHRFTLAPLHDGTGTRFTQEETFTGILVPLVAGTLHRTEEGFELMNRALAARVEGVTPPDGDRGGAPRDDGEAASR